MERLYAGHDLVSLIDGYKTLVFRRGPETTFTIYRTLFRDVDPNRRWMSNYPHPVSVNGSEVRVRLGKLETPWRDVQVFPSADLVAAKEFPVKRFPGAVLREVLVDRKRNSVRHMYQVPAVNLAAIRDYYERELGQIGVSGLTRGSQGYSLDNGLLPRLGITRIYLQLNMGNLVEFATQVDFLSLFPSLCSGIPPNGPTFALTIWFSSNEPLNAYDVERP